MIEWAPTELVLPVVGCLGQVGASTLALAVATVAGSARVVECCTTTASGLATASTAELGTTPTGWALGRRDQVSVARTSQVHLTVGELPCPDEPTPGTTLTVLDVGWELGHALAAGSWVTQIVTTAPTVIVVTAATVPGLRRLETALTLLGPSRTVVAVLGGPRRRWPRSLAAVMGPMSKESEAAGRIVRIPRDRELAVRGLDSHPLPAALIAAAQTLLCHSGVGNHHVKGQPA